jgi:hypothetical protein
MAFNAIRTIARIALSLFGNLDENGILIRRKLRLIQAEWSKQVRRVCRAELRVVHVFA